MTAGVKQFSMRLCVFIAKPAFKTVRVLATKKECSVTEFELRAGTMSDEMVTLCGGELSCSMILGLLGACHGHKCGETSSHE